MPSSAIIIPSRMGSTRFPGKPLCDLLGKPMVQWVYEAAIASKASDRIVVAAPDQEIIEACKAFGAEAILTRNDHLTGTDRIAEVSETVDADVYINVQGDEPLIDPDSIYACAAPMLEDSSIQMASLYDECAAEEVDSPDVVKVVTDAEGFALYFSRCPIPFPRSARKLPVKKHIGIYAYRKEALLGFADWEPAPLELAESLEQLRFMYNGIRIKMSAGKGAGLAVDTPEQAETVRRLLESRLAGA